MHHHTLFRILFQRNDMRYHADPQNDFMDRSVPIPLHPIRLQIACAPHAVAVPRNLWQTAINGASSYQ
jgi:hypothetical protein